MTMIVDWGIPGWRHYSSSSINREVLSRTNSLFSEQSQAPVCTCLRRRLEAGVDKTLTSDGLIKPGLGDAGYFSSHDREDVILSMDCTKRSHSISHHHSLKCCLKYCRTVALSLHHGAPPPTPQNSLHKHFQDSVFQNPHLPASNIIEWIASRSSASSAVYIYDVSEQLGFGPLTKQLADTYSNSAPVLEMQTRPGAGLNLVGRLSEGTSQAAAKGSVLTAYTTPTGLAAMAMALSKLPAARPTSRLIIQDIVVLASATPQEAVDFTTLAYELKDKHVIHIFDHYSACREIGHSVVGPKTFHAKGKLRDVLIGAEYDLFEYHGDASARAVIVAINGPLALLAKAYVKTASGLGLVVVKALRPWDDSAFRSLLPSTTQKVHVLDEVPSLGMRGVLFSDVFSSLVALPDSPSVHSHPVVPGQLQTYLSQKDAFSSFITFVAPSKSNPPFGIEPPSTKKLLIFSSPKSSFGSLSQLIEDLFLKTKNIAARMLTDHDVLSVQGGLTIDRVVLAPGAEVDSLLPCSRRDADFLAIFDHSALKTHSFLKYAKPRSTVLIVAPWTASEVLSNLPAETLEIITARKLRVFLFNAKSLAAQLANVSGPSNETIQNVLVYLAFLRLYLGKAANEALVNKLARVVFDESILGAQLSVVSSIAWSGMEEVIFGSPPTPSDAEGRTPLKSVDFNAILTESDDVESSITRPSLDSWHSAAKHLVFPEPVTTDEQYPQNPALRPELPDRTYLVTCTANVRLTPMEYDRNVFHLEFDTSGTGLTYAIGEALGVHGWNDAQEVLEFCAWYGVDPDRLITIPLPNSESGDMHTRSIFQALQQQIDLFGHPPKSFYSDLATYATNTVDKHSLQFIGSPEGSATYKKLSEKDTVHFVDVLKKYPSARPGIEILCTLIGDIKARHYSIASSQAVVGNRVDLLVVTVDWWLVLPFAVSRPWILMNYEGAPRYGQCTRYLAGLKVGQKVTVSIKPSVMKVCTAVLRTEFFTHCSTYV
ncbi:assimilatory sulfite reductase [Salix suchowensis]|nr:assimilatory sulfite reductase [Salix suchowensis]